MEPLALPGPPLRITDTDVSDAQPAVRAEVVQRLERIWKACEPYILSEDLKPDPRYMETGVRVCDRLIRLYRLDQPVAGGDESDPEQRVDARVLVVAQLAELEARMNEAA